MIRTEAQIKVLVDNAKAFIHQSFENKGVLIQKGVLPQSDFVSPLQIRISNLIYLALNPLATETQKNKGADEIARLVGNFNSQDGVFESNLFENGVFN